MPTIAGTEFKYLRFRGRAGELQRQGAGAALIRELGDNYAAYHADLADELARRGWAEPAPDDFRRDPAGYARAFQELQEILFAEALLRRARAYRHFGTPLDAAAPAAQPLVDARSRLISIEEPNAVRPGAGSDRSTRRVVPVEESALNGPF